MDMDLGFDLYSKSACLIVILALTVLGYFALFSKQKPKEEKKTEESTQKGAPAPTPLPPLDSVKLTMKELAEYDGSRGDGRILVAFKKIIYDVSSGLEEFGPRGTLACVAGRSLTDYLEKSISPVETRNNFIDRWEMLLNRNYIAVGVLVPDEEEGSEEDENEKEENVNKENDVVDVNDDDDANDNTLQMCSKSVKDYMMTDNLGNEQPGKTLIEEINWWITCKLLEILFPFVGLILEY